MNTPAYNHEYYMAHRDTLLPKHKQNHKDNIERDKARRKVAQKVMRESRLLSGLCVQCGKNVAVKGRQRCEACLEKMRIAQASRSKETRAREYLAQKAKRDAKYSAGICKLCGNPLDTKPDGTLYTVCAECREKARIIEQNRRKTSIETGMCTYCRKNKATEGGRMCEACRERAREQYKARKMRG